MCLSWEPRAADRSARNERVRAKLPALWPGAGLFPGKDQAPDSSRRPSSLSPSTGSTCTVPILKGHFRLRGHIQSSRQPQRSTSGLLSHIRKLRLSKVK